MIAFDEQTVGQANRFDRFIVVNGPDFDAGFALEIVEDRVGIRLVLRAIDDDLIGRFAKKRRASNESKDEEPNY